MVKDVLEAVNELVSVFVSLLISSILEDVLLVSVVMVELPATTVECSVLEIVFVLPLEFVLVGENVLEEGELCVFVDSIWE